MFADLDDVIAFLLFFVPTCGVAAWLLARTRSSEPDDLAVDLAASGNLGAAPEPSGVVWFMAALLPQLPAERASWSTNSARPVITGGRPASSCSPRTTPYCWAC